MNKSHNCAYDPYCPHRLTHHLIGSCDLAHSQRWSCTVDRKHRHWPSSTMVGVRHRALSLLLNRLLWKVLDDKHLIVYVPELMPCLESQSSVLPRCAISELSAEQLSGAAELGRRWAATMLIHKHRRVLRVVDEVMFDRRATRFLSPARRLAKTTIR